MTARTFDLPTVRAMVDRFAKLQGLAQRGWRFAVSLVPGLKHTGEDGNARDAWATVATDVQAKTAAVKVRDLAATPLPAEDPWHELEVTISHELWHPWITKLLAEPTVENEEDFAEAAAQAMCARGADARVMARSIEAIPAAVRARVATVRAATAHDSHTGQFTSGAGGAGTANDTKGEHTKSHHILPTNDTTVEKMGGTMKVGNSYDPRAQVAWAHVKAQEHQRPIFMEKNPKHDPNNLNTGGPYKLSTKPPKGEHHEVKPDGSITYHPPPAKKTKAPKGGSTPRLEAPRARGGTMDPSMVQKALDALIAEGQENSECAQILKGIIAAMAAAGANAGGAAPPVEMGEPPTDDDLNAPPPAREEGAGMDPKQPGGPPAARPMARDDKTEDENARRARLRREDDAITAFRREAAKDDLITHVRARLPGHAGLSAVEKRINAAPDFLTAKQIADIAIEMGGSGPARARGAETRPGVTPPPPNEAKPKYEEAKLIAEGINPILAKQIAAETDPRVADMTLGAARARIAANGSPWPTAQKNGGAS